MAKMSSVGTRENSQPALFQSFFSGQAEDNSFRRAREIFAGLMGVLGTIVGFYFGSSEKLTAPLDVAAHNHPNAGPQTCQVSAHIRVLVPFW
jgi:hypothetical protein